MSSCRGAGGGCELTWFQITAVASDSVLARVVVLLGARGGRVQELRWVVEPSGVAAITCLVETPPGRTHRLAGALARVVDVIHLELDGADLPEPDDRYAYAGSRDEPGTVALAHSPPPLATIHT